VRKIDLPIALNTGSILSMVAPSPPAMIASVPSTARFTPPETGASMNAKPAAIRFSPSSLVPTGADELMSISTVPGARCGLKPSTAARTILPSGSSVMTAAAFATASATLAAAAPPAALNLARASLEVSKPTT